MSDERILHRSQDDPNVAIMPPFAGTIDRRHIYGEETMCVSDGRVVRFPRLLREDWGQEVINYDVD